MKSRRKIWSLPLVLVTALLLVGLLGAAVLAQSNDAPKVTKELEDVITATTLELGGTGVDADNDIPEIATADLAMVFTDTKPNPVADQVATTPRVPDPLAFTVMTSAPNTASVSIGTGSPDNYSEGAAPDDGVVAEWWNNLDQAGRRAAVGAIVIDNTLLRDADDTNDGRCWDL